MMGEGGGSVGSGWAEFRRTHTRHDGDMNGEPRDVLIDDGKEKRCARDYINCDWGGGGGQEKK